MKKYLLLLTLIAGTAYGQPSKDTLCLPTENVRALLINAEQGKDLKQIKEKLEQRIVVLQQQIQTLTDLDKETVSSYEAQIKALQNEVKIMTKAMKRERRKRIATGGISLALNGFFIYLLTK